MNNVKARTRENSFSLDRVPNHVYFTNVVREYLKFRSDIFLGVVISTFNNKKENIKRLHCIKVHDMCKIKLQQNRIRKLANVRPIIIINIGNDRSRIFKISL